MSETRAVQRKAAPNGLVEVLSPDTALLPQQSTSRLPSIAEIQQQMTWMTEFRALLVQYVRDNMDPARHMYTFSDSRYERITSKQQVAEMLATGQKPALNQDGIHNLMSLYGADIEDQQVHELREEGFYTVRVTVHMRYFGARTVVGMGSASTRESKYAYRWVGERQVPIGVDKGALKSRTFEGNNRQTYTRYRLDNENVADVEATVLQMAVKRAKSSAVKALPGFSEMFATVGDPDEDLDDHDAERRELLKEVGVWIKSIKASARVRAQAIATVFGEPLTPKDIEQLDEDALATALQVIAIGTKGGVQWDSITLADDLRTARRTSATQAKSDLFGETHGSPFAPQEPRDVPIMLSEDQGPSPASPPVAQRGTGQSGAKLAGFTPHPDTASWRTLRAHVNESAIPEPLREAAGRLLDDPDATETDAYDAATRILDYLDGKREALDAAQTEIF